VIINDIYLLLRLKYIFELTVNVELEAESSFMLERTEVAPSVKDCPPEVCCSVRVIVKWMLTLPKSVEVVGEPPLVQL
jgi:hypothetical protein